jgi:ring-1,2-phenylacetyl-CoA epoxidase subunit PaaC
MPARDLPLRLGDNALVLAQRNGEWCGHAPAVEEDIAMANMALDLLGQAKLWLDLAGRREGRGRDADALAYLRDDRQFRNFLLLELPNRDYGHTVMRQYLFDAWHHPVLAALSRSPDADIAEIAAKAVKEAAYHLDRSRDLVIRLGDGTGESAARMQSALDNLWPYVGEMFEDGDDLDAEGVGPPLSSFRAAWDAETGRTFFQAGLERPASGFSHRGGIAGRHTEHLSRLLAEMQVLQRNLPGMTW